MQTALLWYNSGHNVLPSKAQVNVYEFCQDILKLPTPKPQASAIIQQSAVNQDVMAGM